jgi:hypothetical protein
VINYKVKNDNKPGDIELLMVDSQGNVDTQGSNPVNLPGSAVSSDEDQVQKFAREPARKANKISGPTEIVGKS